MKEVSIFLVAKKLFEQQFKLEYPYLIINQKSVKIQDLESIYSTTAIDTESSLIIDLSWELNLLGLYSLQSLKNHIILEEGGGCFIRGLDLTVDELKNEDLSFLYLKYGKQIQRLTDEEYDVIFGDQ